MAYVAFVEERAYDDRRRPVGLLVERDRADHETRARTGPDGDRVVVAERTRADEDVAAVAGDGAPVPIDVVPAVAGTGVSGRAEEERAEGREGETPHCGARSSNPCARGGAARGRETASLRMAEMPWRTRTLARVQ